VGRQKPRQNVVRRRRPLSAAILCKIEDEDARVASGGPLKHIGMAQRIHRIAIAGEPTLLNRLAGEFVLFGGVFGTRRPVDEVHQVMHVSSMSSGYRRQVLCILALLELLGDLFKKAGEGGNQLV